MGAGIGATWTYDDTSRREDLLGIITNLDPQETQLVSGLGTSSAKDIFHIWLIDTLKTAAYNGFVEGVAPSYADRTDPARIQNVCQISQVAYSVSDTERAQMASDAFSDRYTYEATKAFKELKNDMEFALMRGTLVSGTGTAARGLRGLKNSLSLVTAQSLVSLTEAMLNDYFQNVWNVGTTVNAVYAPMYLKRKISGFTAGSTKNIDASDKRLVASVDIYQGDAAPNVKLFAHRYVTLASEVASLNYDIVGINEDLFKVAYLRKPKTVEMAKTQDATSGTVISEYTLENRHYNAGFVAKNHV